MLLLKFVSSNTFGIQQIERNTFEARGRDRLGGQGKRRKVKWEQVGI